MRKGFRAAVFLLCLLLCLCAGGLRVSAEEQELYRQQMEDADVERLMDALPAETRESLSAVGITSLDSGSLSSLDTGSVLAQSLVILGNCSRTSLCGFAVCMGIMLLCAMTEGFSMRLSDQRLQPVQNAIGGLCVCTAIVVPLCATVAKAAEMIRGAAGFVLFYVPILTGLLLTSGKEVTGASYYQTMMTVGNLVSLAASGLVVPLINVFLALSVSGALSPGLRFSALCESVYKIAKWILTFVMSVFVTVMSLKTLITSSMDNVSRRALRFAVGSFVPVVGNVLGDALTTFNGSLELLRSGAGVFVIIAVGFLVLPVLLECMVWQFSTFVLSSFAEVLGLSQMTGLFKSISKTAGMLTALVLCVLTVFIISTVMLLLAGRGV